MAASIEDPLIERSEQAGITTANNGSLALTVLDAGKVFKRNAIKGVGGGAPQRVTWIVAELDGVRVYIDGARVVMTRQELYP